MKNKLKFNPIKYEGTLFIDSTYCEFYFIIYKTNYQEAEKIKFETQKIMEENRIFRTYKNNLPPIYESEFVPFLDEVNFISDENNFKFFQKDFSNFN